jgi:hypothetical protein
MEVAVNAANRAQATGKPTTVTEVERATGLQKVQAQAAISMAVQLRMLSDNGSGEYTYRGPSELRNSPKEGLPQFFRASAQRFPPFLFFIGFLARGFTEEEASRQTTSIFGIGLATERVTAVFKRWSRYARITDEKGQLDFSAPEILDLGFLNRLHTALRAEVSAQTFVLEEMGAVAAQFYTSGLDLDALGRALVTYQSAPKDAINGVGSLLEEYLAQISTPVGGPASNIGDMLDYLSGNQQKILLKTHKNLGYGVAGFRNAANHGSDPSTGKPWDLTPEAALVGTLLTLLALKSMARFLRDGTQEV